MNQFLADFRYLALLSLVPAFIAMAAVTALEYAFPDGTRTSIRSRICGAALRFCFIVTLVLCQTMAIEATKWYPIEPLVLAHVGQFTHADSMALRVASWIVIYILAVTFTEFWMYWFHRLQHGNRLLWSYHRVHHSNRELNGINALDHFSDPFFALPAMFLPSIVLFSFDNGGPWPYVLTQLVWLHGIFDHAATRLNIGRYLRFLVADNRYHRVHHSRDPAHFDKNFSTRFTLWDWLFGTAYFPKRGESLGAVGIDDAPTPRIGTYFALHPRPKFQNELAAP